MKIENQVQLSFYKEVAKVDSRHDVVLVQHTETGKVFVRKVLKHYDKSVFEFIKQGRLNGVPIIHDLIETEDSLIVIEDYISGHSISEIIETRLFDDQEAKGVIVQLCEILKPFHAHNPAIIHRDIKASNVIMGNDGKVYLIDFDASKRVIKDKNRDTELIGTEEYAAPEQYGFGQSDQRTDIYAMGVLLNKMITGKFPSEAEFKGSFSEIIKKSTEIDPDNRYQNVEELSEALHIIDNVSTTIVLEDDSVINECEDLQTDGPLKRILMKLPYPIRELPGFRSGRPGMFIAASIWYLFLISFGFLGISRSPEYTVKENRFYDVATFALFIVPTLYLGNYLGIRDKLPWRQTSPKFADILRIGLGTVISVLGVIIMFTLISLAIGV